MWLTRLYARFRHLVHELGKFGTVGGVAYVVDTALFAVLVVRLESLTAKTIATVIAATIAFFGNRFWTWRHRERSGLAREYGLYFALNGVGLVIALAILGISHYGLGAVWPTLQTPLADLVAANVIGLGAGTAFRFWSYRRFVFREVTSGSDQLSREVTSGSDQLSREVTSGSGELSREVTSGSDQHSHEVAAEAETAAPDEPAASAPAGGGSALPKPYDPTLAPANPRGPAQRSDVA